MDSPKVSIIISNYNYARFLGEAVGSALGQSYERVEVIVVDDGSTDESRDAIERFGAEVTSIFKQNEGQSAAFDAGFVASTGDVVIFLDADDALESNTVAAAITLFSDPAVVNVHWPLREVDEVGKPTGNAVPNLPLGDGDLSRSIIHLGPESYARAPTSGNAWCRSFLHHVFPLRRAMANVPAETPAAANRRQASDALLANLAPLYGLVRSVGFCGGLYRKHGRSSYSGRGFDYKLKRGLELYSWLCEEVVSHCRRLEISVDPGRWVANTWYHRLQRALNLIDIHVPKSEPYILVDDQCWGLDPTTERRPVPFLERNGKYWGRPTDDEHAIGELERLRASGVDHLVIAWPAFWWFEAYPEFTAYVQERCDFDAHTELVAIYKLGELGAGVG